MKAIYCIAAACTMLVCASNSQGQVLISDTFDSATTGTMPAGWATIYSAWGVSNTASSSPSNSFHATDSNAAGFTNTTRSFTGLTELSSSPIVNLKFDLRIDNYSNLTAGSASTFRVALQGTGTNSNQYVIGLGYATIAGASQLFFYAGSPAAPVPNALNAIGYQAGVGFADGFNLGQMGTGTNNGTGGNFYNFDLTFNSATDTITIIATNLGDPTQSVTFTDTWNSPQVDTGGQIILTTGNLAKGDMYVDNVILTAIPEPSSILLTGAIGLAGLFAHSRRSKKA